MPRVCFHLPESSQSGQVPTSLSPPAVWTARGDLTLSLSAMLDVGTARWIRKRVQALVSCGSRPGSVGRVTIMSVCGKEKGPSILAGNGTRRGLEVLCSVNTHQLGACGLHTMYVHIHTYAESG